MPHSFVCNYMHYVFSTKGRRPLITRDLREDLHLYIAGIARNHSIDIKAIGGTDNHVHLLLSLPATITVAKAIQLIKGVSSKWAGEKIKAPKLFQWQEGYGAFGVGIAILNKTIDYIHNQEEHHKEKSFEEEFIGFLEKHDKPYDERYVWD